MTNDKLVQMNQQQTDNATLAAVKPTAVDPEIIALASAFYASGGGITKEAAVRAAYYVKETGEMEGRDFYLATEGRMAGKILDGYQGIQNRVGRRYQLRYREPTAEDRATYGISPDDYAMICEAYVLDDMEACKAIGFPYEPIVGYCAFAKGSKPRVPEGRNLTWVLRKSAKKDALRQIPGAIDEDDPVNMLSAAEARGLKIDIAREKWAHLRTDQAEKFVEHAEYMANQADRPEAEKQAEQEQTAAAMRRSKYEKRMGMADRCPDCGADLPDHTDGCKWFEFAPAADFDDIPGAREERGELTPAEQIRADLLREAAGMPGEATDRDRQWGVASLAKLWPNDQDRHTVCAFLFGKESTKTMTRGELVAAKNLAGLTKTRNPDVGDPDAAGAWLWIPSEQGIRAARIISQELGLIEQPELLPAEETA